tara:strand:+ start:1385 stop:1639 length:255 start_codon:yes stop_codon:yes gene_type:complete
MTQTESVFAKINVSEIYPSVGGVDGALANSVLINAAPDLLAALQRSEQYLILAVHDTKGDLQRIAKRDLQMVQSAIAKATDLTV